MTKDKENWRTHGTPFLEFTEELTQEWKEQGFTKNQCQDWLAIGLNATDAYYAGYLRDIKNLDCLTVLNFYQDKDLRQDYQNWQLEELKDLKTPTHQPRTFTYQPWLIIAILAVIALYLLTK